MSAFSESGVSDEAKDACSFTPRLSKRNRRRTKVSTMNEA